MRLNHAGISPDKTEPLLQYLASSPEILVGVLASGEEIGWSQPSRYGGHRVQLHRLKVTIKNTPQGRALGDEVNIYCFIPTGNMTGLARMNFAPGDRFIFYLRLEAGNWRTACDDYESCVDRVLTGSHPTFQRTAGQPISDDIARIIYTRGEAITDSEMVDILESLRNLGSRWLGQGNSNYRAILQQTIQAETPPVRAEACQLLNQLGDGCKVLILNGSSHLDKP